jgi:hypothetical protein
LKVGLSQMATVLEAAGAIRATLKHRDHWGVHFD